MRRRSLSTSLLLALTASAAHGQSVIIGAPGGTTNCIPFACPQPFATVSGYQQVIRGSVFAGPVSLTAVGFFGTFAYAPATYTIALSTTTRAVGTLSTNLASNVTGPQTVVFSGLLNGAAESPAFSFSAPFAFDPGQGNLLISITTTGYTPLTPPVQLPWSTTSPECSRAYTSIFGNAPNDAADGICLVTRLDYAVATTVPEPSSWSMVASGLLVLGGLAARRRRGGPRPRS